MTPGRRVTAECLGTAFLLAAVVGSGIMGERLAGGSVGLALLANTLATGAALVVLILTFGPVSGAHLNPVVTLAEAWQGGLAWREAPGYLLAQVAGALLGVAVAHLMFGEPLFSAARHVRQGPAQLLSEFVATFGLVSVIAGCARHRPSAVPFAVAAYITAAYWFTASTSFANPADVPGFIAAQALGAAAATLTMRWLVPHAPR
jgi:glycerol uptake facilitator-like aquaporin